MGRMREWRLCALLMPIVALSCASPASQTLEADDEAHDDVIHSDLPLFRGGAENMWPQRFHDEDSFGCTSRVAFGDWVLRAQGEEEPVWYRFLNYGAFHCWALVGKTYERPRLERAELKPAFFVLLGDIGAEGERRELWVIQIGARPGSEYMLLSRSPRDGLIDAFDVLQTRCPPANVRDAGALDILLTRYCALNTEADLLRLARRMAQAPAIGTLTLVPDDSEP